MRVTENHCVDCPQGCIDCGRKNVTVTVCDCCKSHSDMLYNYDGKEICRECIEENYLEEILENYEVRT